MPALPIEPDETSTMIYNPLKFDFHWLYDGKPIVLPSQKIVTFPKYLADHLAKHLAQQMASADERRIHYEDKMKEYLEKIYIKL